MSAVTRSIYQVLRGAARALQSFPAAIACALAFAVVTMIRIQLDWPQQEAYNFLFNCLHWALALGAVFSLAVITAAQTRVNTARAFLIANLLAVMVVAVTFLALYLFGGTDPVGDESRYAVVSRLAIARVSVAIGVSLIAFIYLAGYPREESDFSRSFFMTHKAFFLALIYGLVIEAGSSAVAGAIQALLYRDMSTKVYMHLGTLSGFVAFTIFAGYFPDFRKGRVDPQRDVAQKHPRFFEVLFEYILIPIVLALTVVLLLWAGKTILSGMGSSFMRISGIATSYTIGGIWLHILVTHYQSGLARFYRRAFPIAALVILAFQAWALVLQLQVSGLKTAEYTFSVVWIFALVSAALLLILKARAHPMIALLVCTLAVFAVLPVVGYQALPVTFQVARLERLLVSQDMLQDGRLTSAATEPEPAVREAITDAVYFLAYAGDAELPAWFDRRLAEADEFKSRLGFEQTWPEPEIVAEDRPDRDMGISLMLEAGAVDISDYRWAVNVGSGEVKGQEQRNSVTVNGEKGSYWIEWTMNVQTGKPKLKIELDDRVILEEDMSTYIDRILAAFPPGQPDTSAAIEDMSLSLEAPEASVLLVFRYVNISVDPTQDKGKYWLELSTLYLKESP